MYIYKYIYIYTPSKPKVLSNPENCRQPEPSFLQNKNIKKNILAIRNSAGDLFEMVTRVSMEVSN